jgi:cytochrome c oxidase assembly protein subunit 15
MRWLHFYLRFVVAASLLLIVAGGLVTSTGSGLAVPDWPNTYGTFMFAFPFSKMVGGIFYEHGHRLIASTVGLLTIGLALWIAAIEPRPWVRRLGWTALAAVIVQGLLGGITVLYFLPAPISIGHAGLAQLFFALVTSLALFTSPGWRMDRRAVGVPDNDVLRRLAWITPAAIFGQILLGATMRHTGAGLAIPDFPLAFGHLVPPEWNTGIAIHFAHRLGALAVTAIVGAMAGHLWLHHRQHRELTHPALLLAVLVIVQVALGAWTVLSGRQVAVNTAHVAVGATTLATALVVALRVHRNRFPDADDTLRGVRRPAIEPVGDGSEARA